MLEVPGLESDTGFGWNGLGRSVVDALGRPSNVSLLLPAGIDGAVVFDAMAPLLYGTAHEFVTWMPGVWDGVYGAVACHATEDWAGSCDCVDECVRACSEHGRDANIVIDLTHAESSMQEQMTAFLQEWTREVQTLPAHRTWPRFVSITNSPASRSRNDAFLTEIPAWSTTWTCEAVGRWGGHLVGRTDEEKLWLRCVLPELAAFDQRLPDDLACSDLRDVASLAPALSQVAEQRGWDDRLSVLQSALSRVPRSGTAASTGRTHLPSQLQPLWHEGMLGLVGGVGWDLHAAILALVSPTTGLHHRTWRGQARVLMPVLEHLRISVEEKLRRDLGNGVFSESIAARRRESRPEEGWAPPIDEVPTLHEMADLARNCGAGWWRLCSQCHVGIRNQLAHGRPVEPTLLRPLLDLASVAE